MKSRLLQERWFSRISYNYYRYASETIPNDIGFPYQYALKNTGQPYGPYDEVGTRGADIKATLGWDWTTGSDAVVIAVIDTGVALNHEDLKNKMFAGYNFLAPASPPQDDEGHGTLVASVAAAETHNHIGIAGVCWKAKIMPLKVLDSSGQGNDLDIATAIQYAADHGAKVINMSLGGPGASFVLQDACRYAYEKGLVLVAATGNESSAVDYPAAFDAYVLAVGASDANDQLAGFSNYGPEVDVVAPGIWILGAYFDPDNPTDMQSYAWASGTSLSTPQVSGAAALLFSYKPFLTADQAMNLLRYTADDVNRSVYAGVDNYMGYGRINLQTLLAPYILKK